MIADRFGNSAIIGWRDGEIYIQRNTNNLQAFGFGEKAVESYFSKKQGSINIAYLSDVLNVAHQEGIYRTQYSNIISLADGKIYLFKSHNYSEYVEINYLQKFKSPYSKYKMADLFNSNKIFSNIKLINSNPIN